jgi:hypothetical protein
MDAQGRQMGLQMGQALRNSVLEPANKKALEDFSTAQGASFAAGC